MDKKESFAELRRALQVIDKGGPDEEIFPEDEQWFARVREVVTRNGGINEITDAEIDSIAELMMAVMPLDDTERLRRLQQGVMKALSPHRSVLGHWQQAHNRLRPAAVFRREGPPNPKEQSHVEEALDRIRKSLDEEEQDDE